MSQTKVQLVSNIVGNVSGGASFTGIVTASSFSGNASGLSSTASVNTSGIVTATGGFNIGIQSAGTNVTTGVITAINFVGTGNTFQYNAGTKTVDVSISGGSGGGIGTAIKYADNTTSPFSYIDAEVTVSSNLNLDTTNAGTSNSYVVSVIPNVTVASGVAVTVGSGKTMVIDVLQIGDL